MIKKLNKIEISYARKLLKENALPYSDIENKSVQIYSIQQDNKIIGIIGFEHYGKHGLLRSFVIEEQYRSKGFGTQVLSDFEKLVSKQGIEEFYLLTTTADKFFTQNGFEVFDRKAVPQLIANTTEFDSICPASAVCMRKNLTIYKIFPEPILRLPVADIPFAGSIAFLMQGGNNQILYMFFEKDIDLPEHNHKAQWGIVLEGQIKLTIGNKTSVYKKGDRYFIPEGVKHSGKIYAGYADITFFNQPDRYKIKK